MIANTPRLTRALVAALLFAITWPLATVGVTADDNIDLVRALYAKMDAQPFNRAALAVYYDDAFVDNNRPGAPPEASDKQAIVGLIEAVALGMPDGKRTLNTVEALGPDKVVVYFTFTGTQTGQFLDYPPSDKSVTFNGIDIFRIAGGRIAEQWHVEEVINLIGQLSAE
jgi:predicted ester cyclase